MKKLLIFFIIAFISCKKKPEVFLKVEYAGDFKTILSFEVKNPENVDYFVMERNDNISDFPFKFSIDKDVRKFTDTTVTPEFNYNYEIKAFYGSDFVSSSVSLKTAFPDGYYFVISPLSAKIKTDKKFSCNLNIYNISDLFGVSFRMYYNSDVLRIDSLKKGDIWDSDDLFFTRIKEDTLIVAISKQRGEEPFSGSGSIIKVYFTSVLNGESYLIISKLFLNDSSGIYLPRPEVKNSFIEVK